MTDNLKEAISDLGNFERNMSDESNFQCSVAHALVSIAEQLTRIADAREKPEHPTLSSLSKNSLDDGLDGYRDPQSLSQDFDEQLSDTLLCKHIYTGHQNGEPMTQNADSRDSAEAPNIQ